MFTIGQLYERSELLHFVGSKQQQSGILWNKEGSDTIIVTTGGRHTKRVSYSDTQQPDGTWIYTGQGETGDQNPDSYANSLLKKENGKKILLFSTREPNAEEVRQRGNHKKQYQFEGVFKVISSYLEIQTEGKRLGDKLVKFILSPINEEVVEVSLPILDPLVEILSEPSNFNALRKKVLKPDRPVTPNTIVTSEYRPRSVQIKKYALLRSEGKCENCDNDAPFLNIKNIPFLEVHHIFSLSDDGPDHPVNVAAICPNCHKEAHYGKDKEVFKDRLSKKILTKEDIITKNSWVPRLKF